MVPRTTPSPKSRERLAGYVIEVTRAGIQGLAIESVTIVVHGGAPCAGKIISGSRRIFNDLPGKGKNPRTHAEPPHSSARSADRPLTRTRKIEADAEFEAAILRKTCGKKRKRLERSGVVLELDVFDLDPVDLDDATAHADATLWSIGSRLIDKSEPPAHPVIIAQDRPARTRFDSAVVESGGVGAG